MDFFNAGKLRGEGAEDVGRCRREKQTEARADQGQEKSFGEQLRDECAARSTQGEAAGDFVLPLSPARQKYGHNAGTRYEQEQRDGAKDHPHEAGWITDDGGVGGESTTSEAIANEGSDRSVEDRLVGRKFAGQHGGNSPHLKETGGVPGASHSFGQRASGLGNIFPVIAGERLESGIEAIPVFKTNWSNQMEWARSFRIVLVDAHKLIGVREREGLEEDGVDGGEDGTVCANGKGQGEDDGGREGWGFTDEPNAGFDIGHRGVQEPEPVDFADFL